MNKQTLFSYETGNRDLALSWTGELLSFLFIRSICKNKSLDFGKKFKNKARIAVHKNKVPGLTILKIIKTKH